MKRIWLSSPHMEGHELKYVNDAFSKNHVFPLGEYVEKFQEKVLNKINAKDLYCLALNSGTSSIHLALKLLNIKKNDEVICSNFTFSASANPILYEGAKPIFVDSEMSTWNMCPKELERCINDRLKIVKRLPKAIILVHLYGMPSKLDEIKSISEKYNIPIIEDAAEAMGSKYKNEFLGKFGEFSIFSFNGNKIITTSGGGVLISNQKEKFNLALKYATQSRENKIYYHHKYIGYNYRLSNISAAIGFGQLDVLEKRVIKRRKIFEFYYNELNNYKGITFQTEPNKKYYSNRWLSTMYFSKKINIYKLISFLDQNNIEARPLWKPMNLQPFFKKYPSYMNGNSKFLFENGICLPSSSLMNNDDLKFVVKKIKFWLND